MTKTEVLKGIAEKQRDQDRLQELITGAEGLVADSKLLLAENDAIMEEVNSGRHGRRMLWRSLSPSQKAAVKLLADGSRTLIRSRSSSFFYDAFGGPPVRRAVRTSTIRNLVAYGLFEYEAVGDDTKYKAGLSAQGLDLIAVIRSMN